MLLDKQHWVFPLAINEELGLLVVSHPYNVYNQAILNHTKAYNRSII